MVKLSMDSDLYSSPVLAEWDVRNAHWSAGCLPCIGTSEQIHELVGGGAQIINYQLCKPDPPTGIHFPAVNPSLLVAINPSQMLISALLNFARCAVLRSPVQCNVFQCGTEG